jgi:hypothetical protein
MALLIACSSLVALLIILAGLGVARGYNVEVTFHPPIFVKIKLTRNGQP